MTGFRSSHHVNGRPLTLLKFPKELAAELLVTIGDSPSGQVVSGNLDLNAVSGENANVMFSHFAAQVTKNFMSIIQLDSEVPPLSASTVLPSSRMASSFCFGKPNSLQ